MVEECSCEALEWGRLLELVASFVHSRVAREWLLGMKPSRDTAWIDQQHDLVGEMRLLLGQGVSPALGGLFDPTRLTDKARIQGALLEPEEIRDLLFLMDNITTWQALIERPPEALAAQLHGLKALSQLPAGAQLARLAAFAAFAPQPGWLAQRRRVARSAPHPPGDRAAATRDRGEPAQQLAPSLGRRQHAGRPDHHTRRALRHPGEGGVQAAHSGRGAWRQLQRPDRLPGAARDDRAKQRAGAADRRGTGRDPAHLPGDDAGDWAARPTPSPRAQRYWPQLDGLQARARFAAEFDCIRPRFADRRGAAAGAQAGTTPAARKALARRGKWPWSR